VHLKGGDCFLLPRRRPCLLASALSLAPDDVHTLFATGRNGRIWATQLWRSSMQLSQSRFQRRDNEHFNRDADADWSEALIKAFEARGSERNIDMSITTKYLTAACTFWLLSIIPGGISMGQGPNLQEKNKEIVLASFDRWKAGTGGPFELLAADADWTIVGSSPLSKTYHSRQQFMDEVIGPFNARMSKPLVPSMRGIFADGDMVIIFFDAAATAKDGKPYHNTYTWYFQMKDGKVIHATAFFDTREFDEFWNRVRP